MASHSSHSTAAATARATISVVTGLPRPRWRGLLHSWAFFSSIPAVVLLLAIANSSVGRVSAAIYGACLLAVFGVSGAYHRLAKSDRAQLRMQRADHSTIYLMIAGTYTPICALALPDRWGIPALVIVWLAALGGVVLKLFGGPRYLRWSNGFYPALGWASIVLLPALLRYLSVAELALLVVGGVLYTVGAVVFLRRRPDPAPLVFGYHEIWHAFTVAAGISHFALIVMVTASRT